ncbi:MAG TPA: hypothetical protein VFV93_06415, partial [Thermomicrobiales bacterium]|nr:hypothetical protein [Thermomicrobiales bacterium]
MSTQTAAPESTVTALQAAKQVFEENKTLTLISRNGDRAWGGKVYFAEHEGDLYIALEQGRNFENVRANPKV